VKEPQKSEKLKPHKVFVDCLQIPIDNKHTGRKSKEKVCLQTIGRSMAVVGKSGINGGDESGEQPRSILTECEVAKIGIRATTAK
jgi:hypothetical protein